MIWYGVGRDVRESHKDYNQVVLDVRRSMKRFPKGLCSVCVCLLNSKATGITSGAIILLLILYSHMQMSGYLGKICNRAQTSVCCQPKSQSWERICQFILG